MIYPLEFQSGFTGSFCKRLDPTMILITASVENNGFDPSCFRLFTGKLSER